MSGRLVLASVLGVIWLALSGMFTPLLLALGVASAALVVLMVGRMDRVDGARPIIQLRVARVFGYLAWLVGEVVRANLDVVRRVVSPHLPISPVVVRVCSEQRSAVGRVIFAHSITLTPGTVTVSLGPDYIEVHSLTAEAAQALQAGEMGRRVCDLETVG